VIDTLSKDEVLVAGFVEDEARRKMESFEQFIAAHKDELTALKILYSQPYGTRRLTCQAQRALLNIEIHPVNDTTALFSNQGPRGDIRAS